VGLKLPAGGAGCDLRARAGAPFEVAGVAVRDPARPRGAGKVKGSPLLTTDAMGLVTRPDVDIVIELMGGVEPARSLLLAAMQAGKSVITANKELLARDSAALHQAGAEHPAPTRAHEGSVAGRSRRCRPLRESLADAVRRVLGIVNGTTNYTRQDDSPGRSRRRSPRRRRWVRGGRSDGRCRGLPRAAKAAILALAFHTRVTAADVHSEGSAVTAADIASARRSAAWSSCSRSTSGATAASRPGCTRR
jgi:homoserine dehydrogenase